MKKYKYIYANFKLSLGWFLGGARFRANLNLAVLIALVLIKKCVSRYVMTSNDSIHDK